MSLPKGSDCKWPERIDHIANETEVGNEWSMFGKPFSIKFMEIALKGLQYIFSTEPAKKFVGPPRWLKVLSHGYLAFKFNPGMCLENRSLNSFASTRIFLP